jgi:hydrogenase nickel incorporation protein HypA/HybF
MHELSIALSLVDAACDEARRLNGERVAVLHVEIGALAGVAKDALMFSFEVAAAETAVAQSRLEISHVAAAVWCERCRDERVLANIADRHCPVCGTIAPRLLRGTELRLVSLEVVPDASENRRGPQEHSAGE